MGQIHITCSISQEQEEALRTMNLSASKLLQTEIENKMQQYNLGLDFSKNRIDEIQKNLDTWKAIVYKHRDYLEKKGLMDDFIKQDGY